MLAVSLSNGLWLGVGFIAAITVVACLAVIANSLRYELEFIRVVCAAKALSKKMMKRHDEAPAPRGDQANPTAGRLGMIGSSSPMPASAESAETEAIMDSPPAPEPTPAPESEPAAAQAA